MKCSVCAQEIPEGRYSEHLESEHGVTNDPTAVLIQHLTGLHSTGADEAGADEGLPDEEPSDADAFEEFLAARPPPSDAGSDDESEDAEPEDDEETEEAAAHAPPAEDATDEDEFEKMLATYPEVDLARKGAPEPADAAD